MFSVINVHLAINTALDIEVLSLLNALLFQVQELGLQSQYYHDQGTYQLIHKFMALPFLPAEAIPEEFFKLKKKARKNQPNASVSYLEHNWIVNNTWPPSC